jgi:hypothetical protein
MRIAAFIVGLVFAGAVATGVPALAQDGGTPGAHPQPQAPQAVPQDPAQQEEGKSLSKNLSDSGGVVRPPPTLDKGVVTPPDTGPKSMPVIPPPGTPGGNPNVQPK